MIIWPETDRWRAPVGGFPPPWASAWGDDRFGLWADLMVRSVTQRMRWIEPSGEVGFLMGSPQTERDAIPDEDYRQWANMHEHIPRRIVVDQGFWLADALCTQAFWQAVMGNNPSYFRSQPDAAQCPVEQVSFDDVEIFLSSLAALPEVQLEGRVSMPMEFEWEYAVRAGSSAAYWWGDKPDDRHANWGQHQKATTPGGRYAANPWGLFDVHGNVWEWCSDPWRPMLDQQGAEPDPSLRVVRGGSWFHHPNYARSSCRSAWRRGDRNHSLGFRVLLRSSRSGPGGPTAR